MQRGHEYYRGVPMEIQLLPKIQWRSSSQGAVLQVVETAKRVLYTGHIGDGKIFIYDVENVVKVRTARRATTPFRSRRIKSGGRKAKYHAL